MSLTRERMAKMADKVAERVAVGENDDALVKVDEAVDAIIAALISLEDNLSNVKAQNVPQRAAIDSAKDIIDTALKPYTSDLVKVLSIFGD